MLETNVSETCCVSLIRFNVIAGDFFFFSQEGLAYYIVVAECKYSTRLIPKVAKGYQCEPDSVHKLCF